MAPQLSVVMTVFNGGRHLREAVQSILAQTWTDFEFLIVDNASTDGSVAVLRSFDDARIRVLENHTNEGQTRALNRGLREAKGDFIARMDADDVSMPRRFAEQINFFKKHPRAGVVGTWHEEIDEAGRYLKTMRYPTDALELKCHLLSDGNLTRRSLAHPTVMFRAAALQSAGGYDESIKFAQDYELWTRMMQGHEIHNIGEPLLKYRVSQKSTSNLNRPEMTAELDRIVSALVRRLWPDISAGDESVLVSMLRNRAPAREVKPADVNVLFDGLFQRLFAGEKLTARHFKLRDRIKMYYVPRLMAAHPLAGMGIAASGSMRQPGVWLDSKLQKNFLKCLLPS